MSIFKHGNDREFVEKSLWFIKGPLASFSTANVNANALQFVGSLKKFIDQACDSYIIPEQIDRDYRRLLRRKELINK